MSDERFVPSWTESYDLRLLYLFAWRRDDDRSGC